MSTLITLFVVLPLAAAFLIPVIGRFVNGFQKTITVTIFLFLAILSVYILFEVNTDVYTWKIGGWEPVNGIPIAIYFVLDGLSAFLLVIISLIGFFAAFYSISYIKRYTAENNYYTLLNLMVGGINGVVLTGDLFNLFVFLEIAVIASYALVAFGVEKNELEASFKYQVLGGMSSILILFGIGMIYWKTKTVNIADVSGILKNSDHSSYLVFTQVFLIAGFGVKAALIPFHAWLPDAHSSAPSPISAMLSGVLIKAVGIYCIIRLFFNMFEITIEISTIITVMGALSMVIGVFLAVGQWDIKRLLAYHSISQMGYVIIGLGMGMIILANNGNKSVAALSMAGGLFHLINHAVFKGLLFLNAGAIEYETGTRNLKEMGGLSDSMPLTYSTSLGASMAISGIPPFNGFFSKLVIILAAIKGNFYLLAFLAVLVSIITLASFMKFQKFSFFNKAKLSLSHKINEVPFFMCFSMVALAILCLGLSLLIFPGVREIIIDPAVDVLMNTGGYSSVIIE
ncbi:MAG: NADH/ubiquinone/plastoquinone (complex I) [Bacteroidetes bacterium]|nr:NADH/ubiquinone/plastoquinone (complex I) [Bacteroidota bacterium]